MENPVPTRIAEFIRDIPPFYLLPEERVTELCQQVVIRYVTPEEVIFREGNEPGAYFYVVHDGAVALERSSPAGNVLHDQCGEGDLFGIRPLVAGDHYQFTARAIEETLLYQVRVDDIREIAQTSPELTWFLAQHFAAGIHRKFNVPKRLFGEARTGEVPGPFMELLAMNFSKSPVTCTAGATIRDVAAKMRAHRIGSMIFTDGTGRPVGILTDRDLRNRVATGDVDPAVPASQVMSSPVVTAHPDATIAAVQIAMMRHGIHHLCLTEDGTAGSKIVGVLSEHDILVQQGYHPAILLRETSRCKDGDALRRIRSQAEIWMRGQLDQGTAISLIAEVMTEINDALVRRAIEISQAKRDDQAPDPVSWCWVSLGSSGRGEQLLRTDQDHAVIYQGTNGNGEMRASLLELAAGTGAVLREAGFPDCPSGIMASNPAWCMTLEDWKNQFSRWIGEPTEKNLMYCGIFFDYRPVYGNHDLAGMLTGHIQQEMERKSLFLTFLAKEAILAPPPLTFFRNFLVERKGEHRDQFDLKGRALMPLVDAARLLALEAGRIDVLNTRARFELLKEKESQNRVVYEQAAEVFDFLLRLRTEHGIVHRDSGRYIDPGDLGRTERLLLRNSFKLIREIQELIRVRFQLSAFL